MSQFRERTDKTVDSPKLNKEGDGGNRPPIRETGAGGNRPLIEAHRHRVPVYGTFAKTPLE